MSESPLKLATTKPFSVVVELSKTNVFSNLMKSAALPPAMIMSGFESVSLFKSSSALLLSPSLKMLARVTQSHLLSH